MRKINWGNGLTRGIQFAFRAPDLVDLVTGEAATVRAPRAAGSLGDAIQTTVGGVEQFEFPHNPRLDITTTYSVMCGFDPNGVTEGGQSGIFCKRSTYSDGNWELWYSGGAAGGNVEWAAVRDGGTLYTEEWGANALDYDSMVSPYIALVTYNNDSAAKLHQRNGGEILPILTGTIDVQAQAAVETLVIGGLEAGWDTGHVGGAYFFGVVWNRALSDAEARLVLMKPDQLFTGQLSLTHADVPGPEVNAMIETPGRGP